MKLHTIWEVVDFSASFVADLPTNPPTLKQSNE